MRGRYWTGEEVERFLQLNAGFPARDLARILRRSVPAVQHMRRKMRALLQLSLSHEDLVRLLQVNESAVLAGGLRQIRDRARADLVLVRPHLRRGRLTGRRHLVNGHVRQPEGGGI